MPRIRHIIGDGLELSKYQSQVLELFEKHPEHVFQLRVADVDEIAAWLPNPDDDDPPEIDAKTRVTPSTT